MPGPISKRSGAAVVVGISDYLHAGRVPRLGYAAVDARAVFRALVDPDVCNFPTENVLLLTDKEATRAEVVATLSRWLPEKARDQEIVVVYFAGHGLVERAGAREQGFLLTHDTDPDDLGDRAVAMSDVVGWIRGLGAGAVVICLDCCHAGKVIPRKGVATRSSGADSFGGSAARFRDMQPVAFEALSGKGRFILASCDEGQSSLEADELKHGLFTYHLLRGLEGEADTNSDGRVGVAELFEYVAQKVEQDARSKFQREQRPWNHASGTGGVYLSAPRRRSEPGGGPDVERMWKEEGAAAAVAEIERQMAGASVELLLRLLRQLRAMGDPAGVVVVFRYLPHQDAAVREQARKALHAISWEAAVAVIKEQARRGDAEALGVVLDGLAAFEAHREVVGLLDDLLALVKGDLRARAFRLLERKRLGLELEKTAALFREIQSPYHILKVLGQGLFASAYLARDESADHDVVVRVLRPEFAMMPQVRTEFLETGRVAVRHVHQNLVCTREVRPFVEHGLYCVVRDYVNGMTLQSRFDEGRRYQPPQSLKIVRQVLAGLEPAHRADKPHGGVKPSNIFLCADDRVILGDSSLSPNLVAGAPPDRLAYEYRYAAPELLRGGVAGPAADQYAVGCVLYALLCGRPPFIADNPFDLSLLHHREPIPPPTHHGSALGKRGDDFVLRLLAKSPAERFRDLEEVQAALEALASTPTLPESSGASPPAPGSRPSEEQGSGTVYPSPSLPLVRDQSLQERRAQTVLPFGATGHPSVTSGQSEPIDGDMPAPDGWQIPGYEILGELGRGGMGVVYKARQIRVKRVVALKMILGGRHAGPDQALRFRTEAEAVARLQHPNIVQIYEVGEQGGLLFFSMEFCGGGSLENKLAGTPLLPAEAAALVETLARAMRAAHERYVIHRDLKPANVLLTEDGTPKITDFGLAKKLDEAGKTQSGAIMGTPSYMAPEQAQGRKDVGPPVDVYAMGAILYECLTGRPPFKAATVHDTIWQILSEEPVPPRQMQPQVPRDLETICLKCLQKEPANRYASAAALAEDLRRFQNSEPITARPVSRLERSVKWLRRKPERALLIGLSVAATGGILVWQLLSLFR